MSYKPYQGAAPAVGNGGAQAMDLLMKMLTTQSPTGDASGAPDGTETNFVTGQMSAPGADPFAPYTQGYKGGFWANDLLAQNRAAGSSSY